MVPPAVDAHLDVVTSELVARPPELQQLCVVRYRAAVGLLELVAVDVFHEAQVRFAAHRALVVDVDTDVLGGPYELRMRITHVEPGERTAAEVAQHRSAGKRVIRHAGHGTSVE